MEQQTKETRLIRKIEEKVKKAIFDYGLIDEGDRLLVGLSGGKDSLALVDLLGRRSRIFNPRFEVVAERTRWRWSTCSVAGRGSSTPASRWWSPMWS